MVFPARLGRKSEKRERVDDRTEEVRAGDGIVFFFLRSSLVVFAFSTVFGSPVLRCRRRFLLPRRQVGVGLCWLRRSSRYESRNDVAVFSSFFSDGVGLCRNFCFFRPCFRRRFRLLGAGSASVLSYATVLGLGDDSRSGVDSFFLFSLDDVEIVEALGADARV